MGSSSSPINPENIQVEVDKDAEVEHNQDVPSSTRKKTKGKRKDVPETNEASCLPEMPKKILSTRSNVWDHFTRTKEDRNKCLCNHCHKSFSCPTSSGTSNLGKHMKCCEAYKRSETIKKQTNGQTQGVITEDGYVRSGIVSEATFREASNEMLVIGELPLSFVESAAWKHFCNKVHLYKPHSRRTATRHIVEMYVKKKTALKKWFVDNKQRVSLTTDIWVSQTTGASYMVITVHFIDDYWKLQKYIIGFKYITDHKGQTISSVLLECLAEWGIEKIFSVTVDNASANTSALKRFHRSFSLLSTDSLVLDGDFMHVRCCAHIINLIVRDGLTKIDDNVCAIRNAISYVRSSITRLRSFELRVDSGKMTRGSLPLDVKTRWNSSYLMLTKALKYNLAFNKMEAEDKLYNDHFLEVENEEKRVGPPCRNDWAAVEKLVRFLVIFYNSTLVVSASTTLNSFKCYGEIVTIEKNLMQLCTSFDLELKTKAEDMLDKFDKYWDGMKNINKMLIVASVFDPRKKMQFARMCFDKLYGKDSFEAKEMNKSVLCVMSELFKEYTARYSNGPSVQASQSSQTSSFGFQEQEVERMALVDDDLGYERMDFLYNEMVDETIVQDSRDELETYLKESVENPKLMAGVEYDVLSWWKFNSGKFPILSKIARDVLAMQVSSVASESAFSTSGRVIDTSRSCLTHYMIEVLICLEQWMKSDILNSNESKLVTMEQIQAEFEYEDKLKKDFDTPRILED